ncbi:hypothetical protein ES332_D02G201200v1 [Gossypium tomentosum]|uniref:Uncharacterized protein n=1 Tax=Gossypium tomentosum TaxID=34277 RepID=A0A5D2LZR1_GOSTO|nr:hypothetical protein ES332_D02G201200v1 [Gossypium tomentosum]
MGGSELEVLDQQFFPLIFFLSFFSRSAAVSPFPELSLPHCCRPRLAVHRPYRTQTRAPVCIVDLPSLAQRRRRSFLAVPQPSLLQIT